MAKRGILCKYLPGWALTCLALACIALNGWMLFPPAPFSIVALSFALCANNLVVVKIFTETHLDEELMYVASVAGYGSVLAGMMAFVRLCGLGLTTEEQRTAFAVFSAIGIFIALTVAMCGGCASEREEEETTAVSEDASLQAAEEGTAGTADIALDVVQSESMQPEAVEAGWAGAGQNKSSSAFRFLLFLPSLFPSLAPLFPSPLLAAIHHPDTLYSCADAPPGYSAVPSDSK